MFQALYSFGECVGVLMHVVPLLALTVVAYFTRGIVKGNRSKQRRTS